MADLFVDAGRAGTAAPYETWAKAAATLAIAAGADAAGDTIYISSTQTDVTGANVTYAFAGTLASPTKLLSVDETGDPASPQVLAAGAAITTGAGAGFDISITGSLYCHGITWKLDTTSGTSLMTLSGSTDYQVYENCEFWNTQNNANGEIVLGPVSGGQISSVVWKNVGIRFASTGGNIVLNQCNFRWVGGSLLAAGASVTTLLEVAGEGGAVLLEGLDLSDGAAGMYVFSTTTMGVGTFTIRNCKMPASWSGSPGVAPTSFNTRYEMYNCDDGDTNYVLWIVDYAGTVVEETTIKRTSGANDGTTAMSWEMTTSANAEFPLITLKSPEIVKWNESTGASMTATVEICHDGASAFTDAEIWLEVQYLGTSGNPLSLFTSDRVGLLTAATAQASSSEAWDGDTGTGPNGSSTWNTRKLVCTFTPQEKGFVHAVVHMAVASKTCFVDPVLTLA